MCTPAYLSTPLGTPSTISKNDAQIERSIMKWNIITPICIKCVSPCIHLYKTMIWFRGNLLSKNKHYYFCELWNTWFDYYSYYAKRQKKKKKKKKKNLLNLFWSLLALHELDFFFLLIFFFPWVNFVFIKLCTFCSAWPLDLGDQGAESLGGKTWHFFSAKILKKPVTKHVFPCWRWQKR